jgi:anti-anti-sigma factor
VQEATSDPPEGAPFEVSTQDVNGTRFVTVSGEVDMSVADALAEALHGPQLFVDMTQVTFIDSTATSCLLHALEASEKLILRRSAQVERLLELSGLSDLFPAPE